MTGKADLLKEVDSFVEQFSAEELREISDQLVEAAFYDWYIGKYGLSEFNERLLKGGLFDAYTLFQETPRGKKWTEWMKGKQVLKKPEGLSP